MGRCGNSMPSFVLQPVILTVHEQHGSFSSAISPRTPSHSFVLLSFKSSSSYIEFYFSKIFHFIFLI